MNMLKCEYNPMRPCPLNDKNDHCTASHVELVLAPHGWLRCATRLLAEEHGEDS